MMTLRLKRLASDVRGIYDVRGKGPGSMPDRALKLHPEAAAAFEAMERDTGGLVYSDVWRSAESSLRAAREKRGVQPPGFSAHNFGLAVDVAVDATLKLRGWSYEELLDRMEAHGWYCYRRDRRRGFEDWHQNFVGPTAHAAMHQVAVTRSGSAAAEIMIRRYYGEQLTLTTKEVQSALVKLKMYGGEVDGDHGPRTTEAVRVFQRAWGLTDDGQAGPRTQRTLAFVAAKEELT